MRKLMLITPLVTLGCLLQAAVPVPAADEILPFKKENDVSPNLDVHRREYASLARVITTPYTLRGVDAPPQTNTPTVAAIVEQLKGANYKPVQLAVKRLDTMLKDAQTSIEAFQAESRQSRAALGEILGGALRGEYTHQVTRPITAPNGRLDFVQETVDDGAMVALESTLLAGATQAGRGGSGGVACLCRGCGAGGGQGAGAERAGGDAEPQSDRAVLAVFPAAGVAAPGL